MMEVAKCSKLTRPTVKDIVRSTLSLVDKFKEMGQNDNNLELFFD